SVCENVLGGGRRANVVDLDFDRPLGGVEDDDGVLPGLLRPRGHSGDDDSSSHERTNNRLLPLLTARLARDLVAIVAVDSSRRRRKATSMSPTISVCPSSTGIAPSIRRPSSKVPFLLCRSSYSRRSRDTVRRAWWRDTRDDSRRMAASSPRPI